MQLKREKSIRKKQQKRIISVQDLKWQRKNKNVKKHINN